MVGTLGASSGCISLKRSVVVGAVKPLLISALCAMKTPFNFVRTVEPVIDFDSFSKVEQFVICSPHDDESWKLMDEMIGNAESFCQMLNIPYR